MTVCVAVSVFEGVVFASDSASTVALEVPNQPSSIWNVYNSGNKVFNLIRGCPIVAMTAGMGNFARAPISSLTKDLRKLMATTDSSYGIDTKSYTMQEVAIKTQKFFVDRFRTIEPPPSAPHEFQYWLGGFPSESEIHEIWTFTIRNGESTEPTVCLPPGDPGLVWGGQPEAINRLVRGYSVQILNVLVESGVPENSIPTLANLLSARVSAPLVTPSMPIQEAIDLAVFLVDTTKRFVRFMPGADIVGGDTDVAVVTRHERFKWIKRKHYYRSEINLLENDHV